MSDVLLSADEHFERLRESVWHRIAARDPRLDRESFEEAYAEWWTREVERARGGRASRAAAPVAFVTESVHRVLIDEARSRARGLARDAKAGLEFVDLDSQAEAAGPAATADQAAYEALVHRILTLVQGELTARELRVFVYAYLYLLSTPETARALGLSAPRVKKDREKIAAKVGERVWAVLSGELELCAAYDKKQLGAVFEILSVHVEDCPTCAKALGGVRRGALAVVPPAEALLLAPDAVSGFLDTLVARFHGVTHRAAETLVAVPPSGRTAAVVAVAATAVAGGAAGVAPEPERDRPPERRAAATATPRPAVTPRPVVTTTPAATPSPTASAAPSARVVVAQRRAQRARVAARKRAVVRRQVTAVATATPAAEFGGFEGQGAAPAPAAPVTASAAAPVAPAEPAAPKPTGGRDAFGIEGG